MSCVPAARAPPGSMARLGTMRTEHPTRPPCPCRPVKAKRPFPLMTLMSAWLIATALQRTNSELARERDRATMEALQKAKAALISYAASEQWQFYKSAPTKFQPGALPCPDRDNDGDSDGLCSSALSRIGRLPWLTIGADNLRDASGEQLWYALSSNFRKLDGTTVINGDTR